MCSFLSSHFGINPKPLKRLIIPEKKKLLAKFKILQRLIIEPIVLVIFEYELYKGKQNTKMITW